MWLSEVPGKDDLLRQGDLLAGIPFPRRGQMDLTASGLSAVVYPSRMAVVLDQCCTVEQQHTVLIGRVGDVRRLPAEHNLSMALEATHPQDGKPYAKYHHRLDEIVGYLPLKANKVWVVELTERLSYGVKESSGLEWLQEKRVARMTPLARAQLRVKLTHHFSNPTIEDLTELSAEGYDRFGRSATAG